MTSCMEASAMSASAERRPLKPATLPDSHGVIKVALESEVQKHILPVFTAKTERQGTTGFSRSGTHTGIGQVSYCYTDAGRSMP